MLQSLLAHTVSNSSLAEYVFSEHCESVQVRSRVSEVNGLSKDTGTDWKAFLPPWIPSGCLVHKGNFCKWGSPSEISTAPSPNNTVGSSHCGMLGCLWLVYRVYRIFCCLWNVVVGNLLCSSWNTIPSEVISATVMWINYCIFAESWHCLSFKLAHIWL